MKRRTGKIALALALGMAATPTFAAHSVMHIPAENDALEMGVAVTMFKSPTCGCCGAWAEHMKEHGFRVTEVPLQAMAEKKAELGVPENLQSCHTAVIGDLVIEGHVPASDIQAYLDNPQSQISGLALPGMPMGSPGMEVPGYAQDFTVMSFDASGEAAPFQEHLAD